jgi:hypothetical protein
MEPPRRDSRLAKRLRVLTVQLIAGDRKKDDEEDDVLEELDEDELMEALANAALGIAPDEAAEGDAASAEPPATEDELPDETALLQELLGEDPKARQRATSLLWELWYNQAGDEARRRLDEAGGLMGSPRTAARAASLLEQLAKDYPAWAEPLNRLATLRFMERKFTESIELCEQVLTLKPHHFACLSGLAMAYYNNREPEKARGAAERLSKVSPAMGLPLLAQLDREQLTAIGQLADRPPELVRALCAYIMKTTGAAPKAAAERLAEGGSLLARLCNMLTAMGLDEGTDGTKPMVEEFATWLQVTYFDGVTTAEHGEALRCASMMINTQQTHTDARARTHTHVRAAAVLE